ncbi:hypothetical protein I3842_07G020800 [Carya illinoinensis]|uniref:ACB domain-containing protein n=1 Tax=Carya illinoinensis TaxID=32201 RepID=A0A922JC55_CARIL|nr:hypothetical protein I3842_07G020800 [Carya illinoinensis]
MAMARATSGLQYPERFYAAASYAGFDGDANSTFKALTSKFSKESAAILYGLCQQATVGPCDIQEPNSWKVVEHTKWKSWSGLGNMSSTEAMRLFVKILEEEDPSWYSRASNFVAEPVMDVQMNHNSTVEPVVVNGNSFETKTIPTENGNLTETQDKDVVLEGLGSVTVYDQWVAPPISGQRPKARYEHGVAVVQDKMYIYGGNHNGRYLNDIHVLDLRSWAWSKIEAKTGAEALESSSPVTFSPCAGHSLIPWENKLLSIAGHTKDPTETIQVKAFDLQSSTWSTLKTYGKAPASRGGQSVTLFGTSLVIFGGEDAKRTLLNDLHILDLETMTWDEIDAVGVSPSPRSDHTAAVHAERYLLIFGGGSHATCFNDLHVLDLQAMEWSRPTQQGRVPVASEGLGVVVSSYNGEDILVSFGGYNGRYNNEVNVLKPSHKSTLQSKMIETPVPDSVSAVHNATNPTRDVESEFDAGQEGKIREIVMDNAKSEPVKSKGEPSNIHLLATLKAEKEELESSLSKEKIHSLQLKQELSEAEIRNTELYKELQSVRGQLAAEQSRCFKLEVDVAELRQKLQTMEALQKELELLQRQKAASEQAALNAKQRQGSGGVWGWLAGAPPGQKADA